MAVNPDNTRTQIFQVAELTATKSCQMSRNKRLVAEIHVIKIKFTIKSKSSLNSKVLKAGYTKVLL